MGFRDRRIRRDHSRHGGVGPVFLSARPICAKYITDEAGFQRQAGCMECFLQLWDEIDDLVGIVRQHPAVLGAISLSLLLLAAAPLLLLF